MKYKYKRTFHMPTSPGTTSDDKKFTPTEFESLFYKQKLQITEKLDGENTSIYSDTLHARSLDSDNHPSRNWVKRFQAEIGHNIPDNWRICGENLFAKHSISYDNLDSYFYGFSIWDENNICLNTIETAEWFELLGIQHVPIVANYFGCNSTWEWCISELAEGLIKQGKEGIVLRKTEAFHYNDFKNNIAKYVRANHVTSSDHWKHQQIIPNSLKVL